MLFNLLKLPTVIVFVAMLASPAAAQDDLIFNIGHTRACLLDVASQADQRQCIGKSASVCMEATASGGSTYGMSGCLNFEAEWWDGQLNSAYQEVMKREKGDDAEFASEGSGIPKKAPALREMQRAWITYRDATCSYEYSQWGGGTGGGPASVGCIMRMTGEQTLYLQFSNLEY